MTTLVSADALAKSRLVIVLKGSGLIFGNTQVP